ncbi:hypothetical protein ACIBHY_20205 [Nonomuraea sp. NPDC050547]|uniref:hypothetical protein n=1 Tax=Nonomuraea sp. NPDC050547 TaxID=3364368 RepID=UPI00379550A6
MSPIPDEAWNQAVADQIPFFAPFAPFAVDVDALPEWAVENFQRNYNNAHWCETMRRWERTGGTLSSLNRFVGTVLSFPPIPQEAWDAALAGTDPAP